MSSDAKTVRGLSIAIVILSAIGILFALRGFALLAWVDMLASDPSFVSELNSTMQSAANDSSHLYDDDYESYRLLASMDAATAMNTLIAFGGALFGALFVCVAISLVSGILGIKNCNRREKLGSTFGWMIAGAVLSLLSGRLVTMVLTIIAAVYVNRVKKAPVPPADIWGSYPQQPYPLNQQPYQQQPMNPGQPYGGQPTNPAQPYGGQPGAGQPSANPGQPYGGQTGEEQRADGASSTAMLNRTI